MSKQTATNTWNDGLNKDLNPVITPNTVLTDNLNGTFITYNGNEFSLQNDMGNIGPINLSKGFYPIGLTEFGDIIYIISINENSGEFEIGSFPALPDDALEEVATDLIQEYRPFKNLIKSKSSVKFRTLALSGYDRKHPVSIEVQPSYDGSVNLIFTDNQNVPRLINSGFAVLKNGQGKRIKRNQGTKTNYYDESKLEWTSRLINNTPNFTNVDLNEVAAGGQLKGGNYTFYVQFGDEDGNKTDIVCESGIVSVFKGTVGKPNTISGTLQDELTDKLISLKINDCDTNFSRIYLSYTREYCDQLGYRLVEAKTFTEPYKLDSTEETIIISGVESVQPISIEELNIGYHTVSSVKAMAQQQNMLFLGNITSEQPNSAKLQYLSYQVNVGVSQSDTIGYIDSSTYESNNGGEYYNPQNIYYKLGYWPDELYRLGIVYINQDGTTTDVYNLKGCVLSINDEGSDYNNDETHTQVIDENVSNLDDSGVFLKNTTKQDNIFGVFKTPDLNILRTGNIYPISFWVNIPLDVQTELSSMGISGYFIVRQKRIPLTLCQGFSVNIAKHSYIPVLTLDSGESITQGFLSDIEQLENTLQYKEFSQNTEAFTPSEESLKLCYLFRESRKYANNWAIKSTWWRFKVYTMDSNGYDQCVFTSSWKDKQSNAREQAEDYVDSKNLVYVNPDDHVFDTTNYFRNIVLKQVGTKELFNKIAVTEMQNNSSGLICVDAMLNPETQSTLCGTEFKLVKSNACKLIQNGLMFLSNEYETPQKTSVKAKLTYIPSNNPLKWIENVGFSTQQGSAENIRSFGSVNNTVKDEDAKISQGKRLNFVRGLYCPYIATVLKDKLTPNTIYSIRSNDLSFNYTNEIVARSNNSSEYYVITNKTKLNSGIDTIYRGDCFSNTVTVRIIRNFIDPNVPVADKIVSPDSWKENYKGFDNTGDGDDKTQWNKINLSDVNTVSLGHWLTYKCLSNYNLGLRSEDTFHTDEMALMGNSRSFYPLIGASTATSMKVPESELLNNGYSATVSRRRNILHQNTPYEKNEFSNRVMFSNVNVTDSFTNGYRTFQGLSYQDYTKQFGSIIKLVPWGNHLFCVFEHGLAMLPVNEKALMQTTTEQTIHIYGHGVLPEQLSIISQDFGSLWADSVIRTPIGIYGVDTDAKKIWRYTDKNGLETLSDMKLQRFLNDHINLKLNRQEHLGYTNVKTHYNNYKGDVMFTFYHEDEVWNLCYNERQNLWITRYDWTPLHSGNINNRFYTLPLIKSVDQTSEIGIWKHGRIGIDYNFKPTNWYGEQHPFEIEFVVNDPQGVHKIFENLVIISNNVQPKELEFEFIGDSYLFNKARIYHDYHGNSKQIYGNIGTDVPYDHQTNYYSKDDYIQPDLSPLFYNADIGYDPVLDEYTLIVNQPCKNVETYGRRLGNIQYKEDGWYTNIEPLRFNKKLKDYDAETFSNKDEFVSTKLRDKWVKIRVKYKGDQLAIINAISTLENISYA